MAPKTRKVNKKLVHVKEERLNEEGPSAAGKSKAKKRKLVDLVGPRWTKKELGSFYVSYRKYGKDWKKVSGTLRNKTSDMVQALYNMNRAYLSLPEGAATAAGLIAMMTDHYSIVGGNNGENGSDESPKKAPAKAPAKAPPKNVKGKQKMESKDPEAQIPNLHSYEPASFGFADIRPRAVGKRTPRIPTASIQNRGNLKLSFPSTTMRQDDDEEERTAAMVLVNISRRSFPQAYMPSSDVAAVKNYELQKNISKEVGFHDEGEGTLRSRQAENKNTPYSPSYIQEKDTASIGAKIGSTSKKYNKKKQMSRTVNTPDDDQEVRNSTEGHDNCSREGLKDDGDADRQQRYGGGALVELSTLADLSLRPPIAESESLPQIKDDNDEIDSNDKHSKPNAKRKMDKRSIKGNPDDGACKKTKTAKESATLEVNYSIPKSHIGKKHKATPPKMIVEEENVTYGKVNSGNHGSPVPRVGGKFVNPVEVSPSMTNVTSVVIDGSKILGVKDLTRNSVKSQIMSRSRRKSLLVKAFSKRENWHNEITDDKRPSSCPPSAPLDLKEKLSHTLSNSLFRRWCRFEWFYSVVDYSWFVQNEFVEWLNHLKLGHYRLTRNEWGFIRGYVGKTRRFSAQYLKDERAKLIKYRESVRKQYKSLLTGKLEGLLTDLVCPLFVGQHVIACHPKFRELHDGSILSIVSDHCGVQFDRTELGTEFVLDIDCMLLHPVKSMLEVLKRGNVNASELDVPHFLVQGDYSRVGSSHRFQSFEYVNRPDHTTTSHPTSSVLKQDKERETDIKALAELSRAINKKEALLMELRNMNEDILQKHIGNISDLKQFRNMHAIVNFQLQEANYQVDHALHTLKQHNTYNGDTRVPLNSQELDNNHFNEVVKLMDNSRQKAKMMVDAAVQVTYTTNKGEDPGVKIREVLDRLSNCNSWSGANTMGIRYIPTDAGQCIYTCQQENPTSTTVASSFADAESSKMRVVIKGKAGPPSELISACISTYLMIQSCTEKQYPPAEVTHMLDLALSSMQPCCPENIGLYRDIELCINTIKSMMLALIPTPTPITPMPICFPITR